jgi:hypothetical protein
VAGATVRGASSTAVAAITGAGAATGAAMLIVIFGPEDLNPSFSPNHAGLYDFKRRNPIKAIEAIANAIGIV